MYLAGDWTNDYGSTMTLQTDGRLIGGEYRSHTGASGTYAVVGCAGGQAPTLAHGRALSLAIAWRPLMEDDDGPASSWVSGLGGQLTVENGEPVITLAHLLVASRRWPQFCDIGSYIDELRYRRVGDEVGDEWRLPQTTGERLANPAAGTWASADGMRLEMEVLSHPSGRLGSVRGVASTRSARSELVGVTDTRAIADSLELQAVAITLPDGDAALALAGTINLQTGVMALTQLLSRSTPCDRTYLQTAIASKIFRRV